MASAQDPAEHGEQDLERAAKLFEKGAARYDTSDYEGAIEAWTEAYALVEPTDKNREIRNDLVYNISTAQFEAFKVDGDVEHLRQAKQLLERYLDVFREIYGESPETLFETTLVQDRIAELDQAMEQALADERQRKAEEKDARGERQAQALVLTGAVLTGVGGGLLGGMVAGLVVGKRADEQFRDDPLRREDHRIRGQRANTAAVVTGILGGIMVAGGVTMLVVGKRMEKKVKVDAMAAPGFGGVLLSGRF